MAKANANTTTNPDASMLEMVHRHDEIWAEWDRLDDGDPRVAALCDASVELAHRILMFPVLTDRGLTEKKRVVAIEEMEIESNHFVLEKTGSDFVEFVYKLDAERIAAAG
jgi:hypothetical protein